MYRRPYVPNYPGPAQGEDPGPPEGEYDVYGDNFGAPQMAPSPRQPRRAPGQGPLARFGSKVLGGLANFAQNADFNGAYLAGRGEYQAADASNERFAQSQQDRHNKAIHDQMLARLQGIDPTTTDGNRDAFAIAMEFGDQKVMDWLVKMKLDDVDKGPPGYEAVDPSTGELGQFIRAPGDPNADSRGYVNAGAKQTAGSRGFDRANTLRDEFMAQSKDIPVVRVAMQRVRAGAQMESAAGDMALIFGFMKLVDPGSTVREGEFATAEQSGSVPQRIVGLYNRVYSGQRLTPEQRADFIRNSEGQFRAYIQPHLERERQYRGLATRAGADPAQVVLDLLGEFRNNQGQGGGETAPAGFSTEGDPLPSDLPE